MAIHRRRTVIFIFLGVIFAAAGPVYGSDLAGRIRVSGPFAEPEKIAVKKDEALCGPEQFSEKLLISPEGYLRHAVVSLEGDFKEEFPAAAVPVPVLDQKNCRFTPHVLVVSSKQIFQVGNGDPTAHDVRAFDEAHMLFRFEMDPFQNPVEKKFEKPGRYVIRCGLHKWMHAIVISAEHPYYAVSDAEGNFQLKDIPAGKYALKIWHETLGETSVPVDLSGGSALDFRYTFTPKIHNA